MIHENGGKGKGLVAYNASKRADCFRVGVDGGAEADAPFVQFRAGLIIVMTRDNMGIVQGRARVLTRRTSGG